MSNVGSADRIARIVLGLVLIAYAIPIGFPQTGWNWVGWIGVVPILTAVFAYCPLTRRSACPSVPPSSRADGDAIQSAPGRGAWIPQTGVTWQ
jgi:hypothetical protein